MRLSLDTHILLWWYQQPEVLEEKLFSILIDRKNVVFVSSVVLWEITIKKGLGKLQVPPSFFKYLEEDFEELPISWKHAIEVQHLEGIHFDPFDRLLLAQAKLENLTLVTRDKNILKYTGVNLMQA